MPYAQKGPKRLPVVMTEEETFRVITALKGVHKLIAKLLYGSGLRLMECLRLRVKDIDLVHYAVTVRDGKGGKDRVTVFPDGLAMPLQEHLQRVKMLQKQDLERGFGAVHLPFTLARKYPRANRE
jgi:integrase